MFYKPLEAGQINNGCVLETGLLPGEMYWENAITFDSELIEESGPGQFTEVSRTSRFPSESPSHGAGSPSTIQAITTNIYW